MTNPWVAFVLVPMIKIVVILGTVVLATAYMSFFERRLVGFLQIRLGPNRVGWFGVLQPIADGWKRSCTSRGRCSSSCRRSWCSR